MWRGQVTDKFKKFLGVLASLQLSASLLFIALATKID
jgi:hypothetical protein